MNVFFATHNDLGRACLEALTECGTDVTGVFTRPQHADVADQTDLQTFATDHSIALHEVENINADAAVERMQAYDSDVLFVVGWSQLVEQRVIDIPEIAALGMHPSPLPRGRGRAPIAWSIIKGLEETALTIFHLVTEADAGDIVGQHPIRIERTDDAARLYEKVVHAGKQLIREHYQALVSGNPPRTPQDESEATWWPKRDPHHGRIDWNQSAETIYNWIRGQTHPYPGAFLSLDGRKVRIWSAAPPTGESAYAVPGENLEIRGQRLATAAWESVIELKTVKLGDNKERNAAELVEKYGFELGERFQNLRDRSPE